MDKNTILRGQEILTTVEEYINQERGTTLIFLVDDYASIEPLTNKYGWDSVSAGYEPETTKLYIIVNVKELLKWCHIYSVYQ